VYRQESGVAFNASRQRGFAKERERHNEEGDVPCGLATGRQGKGQRVEGEGVKGEGQRTTLPLFTLYFFTLYS
jgi:hypothetical protein